MRKDRGGDTDEERLRRTPEKERLMQRDRRRE
jgi:hypothetical protein